MPFGLKISGNIICELHNILILSEYVKLYCAGFTFHNENVLLCENHSNLSLIHCRLTTAKFLTL